MDQAGQIYSSDVAFTPAVKAVQERKGSRRAYARMENNGSWESALSGDLKAEIEAAAQPVTDPATGNVISFLPGARLGRVRVLRVEPKISFAQATDGGNFDRGQWLVKESSSDSTSTSGR